jgi:hypothetical protein
MIACTDKDGRIIVRGSVREWILFLERLDPNALGKGDEASKAREILIVASCIECSTERRCQTLQVSLGRFISTANGSQKPGE